MARRIEACSRKVRALISLPKFKFERNGKGEKCGGFSFSLYQLMSESSYATPGWRQSEVKTLFSARRTANAVHWRGAARACRNARPDK